MVREPRLHPDEQREASEEQGHGEQGEVERRQPARKRTLKDHSPVCTHQVGQRVVVVYESQVLRQRLRRPEYGCQKEGPPYYGSEDLAHVGHVGSDYRHDVSQTQGEQQLQHDDQGQQQDLPVQPVLQDEHEENERTYAEELVNQRSYRVGKGEQLQREDHLREDQRQEEDPDQGSQYRPREAQIGPLVAPCYLAADKVP